MSPETTIEVAVEQRVVGLYSATNTLLKLNQTASGREVISRPQCIEDLETVRDCLSQILDKAKGTVNG